MSYTIDEIQHSQEIFYYLLEHHEIRGDRNKDIYSYYTDSENVQNLVHSQAEVAGVIIERYEDVIYMMPLEDNYFLGFSKTELRQQFCRSGGSDADYYLALFCIMVIILNFYDSYRSDPKMRDYLRVGDLQNSIAKNLEKGASKYSEEDESESCLLFTSMKQAYESLRSDEKLSRRKTTKEGFLFGILKFLQDQNLIIYIEKDEMIKTTRKFDHFMSWNLLDKENYKKIMKIIKELPGDEENEQD